MGKRSSEKEKSSKCTSIKVIVRQTPSVHERCSLGMDDGKKITFNGEGDQEPGLEPGDIIVVLDEKEHPIFKRDKTDLHMKMKISLTESLCGFQKAIKTLDNRQLVITSMPGREKKQSFLQSNEWHSSRSRWSDQTGRSEMSLERRHADVPQPIGKRPNGHSFRREISRQERTATWKSRALRNSLTSTNTRGNPHGCWRMSSDRIRSSTISTVTPSRHVRWRWSTSSRRTHTSQLCHTLISKDSCILLFLLSSNKSRRRDRHPLHYSFIFLNKSNI